jgi:hypothetical protein
MSNNNFLFYFGEIVFGLARDLIFFPVWWYTRGFVELAKWIGSFWADSLKGLNLAVWLKNIFVPMYGQRDFAGIAISIFMRIVQIILRSIGFACLLLLGFAVMLLWLALPVLILWQIIFQLS